MSRGSLIVGKISKKRSIAALWLSVRVLSVEPSSSVFEDDVLHNLVVPPVFAVACQTEAPSFIHVTRALLQRKRLLKKPPGKDHTGDSVLRCLTSSRQSTKRALSMMSRFEALAAEMDVNS